MQLATRGNSSNKFFQISCNFLEDTVNPLCYNLLIWDIIFNYFLKPWWQSILTALYPEGEFSSCSSIKSLHSSETSCQHIQEQKKYLGSNGISVPDTLHPFLALYTMFSWVKTVVFTLCISELQSRKKACCSTWSITIIMPIQSKLWSKLQCLQSCWLTLYFRRRKKENLKEGEYNTWIWRA